MNVCHNGVSKMRRFPVALQLDATDKSPTLPIPMNSRVLAVVCLLSLAPFFPGSARAAVIFRPPDKSKYVAPGEEKMSGNAQELFDLAQKAESEGDAKRALRAYRTLVRRYPKDALAPGSAYRTAQLQEQMHDYLEAAASYRYVVERYPTSPRFNEAIEAQFRIGELYLAGKKLKLFGLPFAASMDKAVEVFAAVIRTAPYGKYTARAQFDIGLAREKQGANDAALQAYQAVVDKFPTDPIAAQAQYQIGYIWFTSSRSGTKDLAAANNARTAFEDFLYRYPNSEKAPQAKANLQMLEHKTTASSYDVARFYDKQKNYRAAVIYYNEVIRQQPGSAESEEAKKRIDQLRSKLGEKALQSAADIAAADEKKKKDEAAAAAAKEKTSRTDAISSSPDPNSALPPPPAPDKSPASGSTLFPDITPAPAPENSTPPSSETSPEAAASPTP
jgi:outer membrane protein assembly factor BamD